MTGFLIGLMLIVQLICPAFAEVADSTIKVSNEMSNKMIIENMQQNGDVTWLETANRVNFSNLPAEYFIISKMAAHPGQNIKIEYSFKMRHSGQYTMWLLHEDSYDNFIESYSSKNLEADKSGEYIRGEFMCKMPVLPKYPDTLEFRVYGPVGSDMSSFHYDDIKIYSRNSKGEIVETPFESYGSYSTNIYSEIGGGTTRGDGKWLMSIMGRGTPGIFESMYDTKVLCPKTANPGQTVTVSYEGSSDTKDKWMAMLMFNQHGTHVVRGQKVLTEESGLVQFTIPPDYGYYQFVVYYDYANQATGTSDWLEVGKPSPIFYSFPSSVFPGEMIKGAYKQGSTQINAWIGIFPQGDTTNQTSHWESIQGKTQNEIWLSTPKTEGKYVFKMLDTNDKVLATSTAFEISSKTIPLAGNVIKASGQEGGILLDWSTLNNYKVSDSVGVNLYRSNTLFGKYELVNDFPINDDSTYVDTRVKAEVNYIYYLKRVFKDHSESGISKIVIAKAGNLTNKLVLKINSPKMTLNGVEKEVDPGFDTKPVIDRGRTFLPIRSVIETLGGKVGWNGTEQKVSIVLKDTTIDLWLNKNTATVNKVQKNIDAEPFVSTSGRTMVPLRFVVENLGYQVVWDGPTSSVTIIYNADGSIANGSNSSTGKSNTESTGTTSTGTTNTGTTSTGSSSTGTSKATDIITDNSKSGLTTGKDLNNTSSGDPHLEQPPVITDPKVLTNETESKIKQPDSLQNQGNEIPKPIGTSTPVVTTTADVATLPTAWVGKWDTTFGVLELKANNTTVEGTYSNEFESGTVKGLTSDGKLTANTVSVDGKVKFTMELTLSADGMTVSGRYKGTGDWQKITGKKLQ